MNPALNTNAKLAAHISATVAAQGGILLFSRRHDISEGHIRAVCEGRVRPGPRLQKACGVYVVDSVWYVDGGR